MSSESSEQHLSPYVYELPSERIAQRPVQPPESALMVYSCKDRQPADYRYSDLPQLLSARDVLVFNHTAVNPARIRGFLEAGSEVEFLLLRARSLEQWECLARPLKKLVKGVTIACGEGLTATVLERIGDRNVLIQFCAPDESVSLSALLERVGEMPIPPYIRRGHGDEQDRSDYQSMFARVPGSIAAPTASLHFSPTLIADLEAKGIRHHGLVLHLGTSSFLPVFYPERAHEIVHPGSELYVHSEELLRTLADVRSQGGRVIAVGTSVVRALESMTRNHQPEGTLLESSLFITPGFEYQMIDGLITNFHQPGTTHLLLVEAFIGRERLDSIYTHALQGAYRFLSYGDGMLLLGAS